MYLMTFKNEEGREFFLYDLQQGAFVGGEDEAKVVENLWHDVPLAVTLPSAAVKQLTVPELHTAIGGLPFTIYTFHGGVMAGRAWHGVENLHRPAPRGN
jgi:hypothetical protein